MVAKTEVYMCQYCHSIYLKEKDAIDCENMHTLPENLEIIDARNWDQDSGDNKKFPKRILVQNKKHSGNLCEYQLVEINSMEEFYEKEPWNELGEWGTKIINQEIE